MTVGGVSRDTRDGGGLRPFALVQNYASGSGVALGMAKHAMLTIRVPFGQEQIGFKPSPTRGTVGTSS